MVLGARPGDLAVEAEDLVCLWAACGEGWSLLLASQSVTTPFISGTCVQSWSTLCRFGENGSFLLLCSGNLQLERSVTSQHLAELDMSLFGESGNLPPYSISLKNYLCVCVCVWGGSVYAHGGQKRVDGLLVLE